MSGVRKKVLLFDDDYESMSPLKILLEQVYGYQVELTAAQTLLERLRAERFDLICVDFMIHPKSLDAENQEVVNLHFDQINWQRTGQEFLKRLRRGDFAAEDEHSTPLHVPVIVLSAVADTLTYDSKADPMQITRYMEKPFDPEELAEVINQTLKDVLL